MEDHWLITLIVVGGIVWGGFIYFLASAIKYERDKNSNE